MESLSATITIARVRSFGIVIQLMSSERSCQNPLWRERSQVQGNLPSMFCSRENLCGSAWWVCESEWCEGGTRQLGWQKDRTHLVASGKFTSMNSLSLLRFTDTVCGGRVGERGLEGDRRAPHAGSAWAARATLADRISGRKIR
jgi:hypothetical protein